MFVMADRKTKQQQSPASSREGEVSATSRTNSSGRRQPAHCLLRVHSLEKKGAEIDFYLHQYCICLKEESKLESESI